MVVAASVLCLLLGMSFEIRKYAQRPSSRASVLIDGREPASLPSEPTAHLVRQPAPQDSMPVDLMNEPAVRTPSSKDRIFHLKGSGGPYIAGKESTLVDLGTVGQELARRHYPCHKCLSGLPRPDRGTDIPPES